MSIISQLWSAVAGENAEQANDTNDGSLPSNPFSPRSPAASRPATTASIDLTSPTRRSDSSDRRGAHTKNARSSLLKNARSEDKRRLLGDFNVSADYVSAPDPGSYFRKTMTKPGSNNSYKPLNTLYDPPGTAKHKVYGKSSRKPGPSIGKTQGQGQLAFLNQWSPSIATTRPSARVEQTKRPVGPSPSKRRKIEPDIIDLSDDNDYVQEITSHQTPITPARPQNGLPRLSHSTRSQRSVGSGRSMSGRQPGSQSTNEFLLIEEQMQPRSKKHETSKKQRRLSFDHSASGSVTPVPQGTSNLDLYAETEPSRGAISGSIFHGFEQGVLQRPFTEQNSPGTSRPSVSHYFPNARINESTAPQGRSMNARQLNGDRNRLRTFRRNDQVVSSDPISDDELGMDVSPPQPAPLGKPRSGLSTSLTANGWPKRTSKAVKAAHGWRLIWARNLDFDSHNIAKPEGTELSLHLAPDGQKGFRIVSYDDISGIFTTQASIVPQDVVKVLLDDVGHIRLEGSRNQDGNRPIADLEFSSTADFEEFRDTHVAALSGRDVPRPKEEKHMRLLFSKRLNKNNKVGSLNRVNETRSEADGEGVAYDQPKKRSLWKSLKSDAQDRHVPSPALGAAIPSTSSEKIHSSIRPTRSTRVSAAAHVVEDEEDNSHIEKYSEVIGLGKRWRDPLTFREGRLRATVDFQDLLRLDEGEFLNDNLIDFYMIYCFKQNKVPQDKVFLFNTFFFSRLTENTGRATMNYDAVKRWTAKIDIFKYDYIVVPINEDTHWYLAIICNVDKIEPKKIQEDSGDNSAQEAVVEPTAVDDQGVSEAVERPAEPKLVDTLNFPISSRTPSVEQVDNDVNLFDEKSELDLIDREAGSKEEKQQTSTHVSSVPQVVQQDTLHESSSILSPTGSPKTVLSNLNISSKKSKRRSLGPKRDLNLPVVIVLDSLSQTRSSAVRALKDWLAAEGKHKHEMEAVIREKGCYPKSDQIPTQSNFSDCGVYLLGYAEKFFQDPDEFKTKLLLGEMTAAADWPQLKPAEMRNNLRDILFGLANEQELTVPKKKRGKKAASTSFTPPQPTVEPVKSKKSPTPSEVSKTTNPHETSTIQEDTVTTDPGTEASVEDIPNKPTVQRLGSPFKLRSPTAVSSEQQQTPGRRTHPEVRIPNTSLASHLTVHGHEINAKDAQTNRVQRQTRQASKSISPFKRARETENDDELETSPRKKASVERKLASFVAPPQDGHSDQPIEITDSQDSWPAATQPLQGVHRDSSILASTIQRKKNDVKEKSGVDKLVARLNADDTRRQLGLRESALELDRVKEPGTEPMDVYPEGHDPMDDIIGETPSPDRSSPGTGAAWVKGDALPH